MIGSLAPTFVPRKAASNASSRAVRAISSVPESLLRATRLARATDRARVAIVSIAIPVTMKSESIMSTINSSMPLRSASLQQRLQLTSQRCRLRTLSEFFIAKSSPLILTLCLAHIRATLLNSDDLFCHRQQTVKTNHTERGAIDRAFPKNNEYVCAGLPRRINFEPLRCRCGPGGR